MATKEEIAHEETFGVFDEHELGITGLSNAMDRYAKQESIEFITWVIANGWEYSVLDTDTWFNSIDVNQRPQTEQLYELFKQHQLKKG